MDSDSNALKKRGQRKALFATILLFSLPFSSYGLAFLVSLLINLDILFKNGPGSTFLCYVGFGGVIYLIPSAIFIIIIIVTLFKDSRKLIKNSELKNLPSPVTKN